MSRRLLAVVVAVDFLELGIDDTVVLGLLGALAGFGVAGLGLVHGLAQLHRSLDQGLGLGLDDLGVALFHDALEIGQGRFNGALLFGGDLVAVFGEGLLRRVQDGVGLVAGLDPGLALLVLGAVGLGFLDHLVDVRVGEAAVGLDADRLFLVGSLVLGGDVHDAVGVDVEDDFDLRHAARRRRDADQVELAQHL